MAGTFAEELLLEVPEDAPSPSKAGGLPATVTGRNFEAARECTFDPEGSAASNRIVAISTVTTAAGTPSTIITLPDGTVMTLVGVASVTPVLFAP